MNSIYSFLEVFNTYASFVSFFVSIFTFLLAFRINKKVKFAEETAILKTEKDQILGELKYYLISLRAGSYNTELGDQIKVSIIDIESRYRMFPNEIKKSIKNIYKEIDSGNGEWAKIRKSLNKIITYIERC